MIGAPDRSVKRCAGLPAWCARWVRYRPASTSGHAIAVVSSRRLRARSGSLDQQDERRRRGEPAQQRQLERRRRVRAARRRGGTGAPRRCRRRPAGERAGLEEPAEQDLVRSRSLMQRAVGIAVRSPAGPGAPGSASPRRRTPGRRRRAARGRCGSPLPTSRLEALGQVHRGRLALQRGVRGDDDLLEPAPPALRLARPAPAARGSCRRSGPIAVDRARWPHGGRGTSP